MNRILAGRRLPASPAQAAWLATRSSSGKTTEISSDEMPRAFVGSTLGEHSGYAGVTWGRCHYPGMPPRVASVGETGDSSGAARASMEPNHPRLGSGGTAPGLQAAPPEIRTRAKGNEAGCP